MIINANELSDVRQQIGAETMALRLGCYDLLHTGHQQGINFTSALARYVTIGVMPDSRARRKGPGRPINPESSRVEAIDAASGVDFTFVYPEKIIALAGAIRTLRPDVYVEDEENEHNWPKALLLRSLSVNRVIDHVSRQGSTSLMIATLGIAEAQNRASLTFQLGETQ